MHHQPHNHNNLAMDLHLELEIQELLELLEQLEPQAHIKVEQPILNQVELMDQVQELVFLDQVLMDLQD